MDGAVSPAGARDRRVGLCAGCAHASRVVSARGSVFWRCGLAERDPAFEKYPRLPVLVCGGYRCKPTEA